MTDEAMKAIARPEREGSAMTDTNNTDGAALLPVTADSDYIIGGPHHYVDPDSVEEHWTAEIQIVGGHYSVAEIYATDPGHAVELAEKAIAAWNTRSQSHSLPGDVGMRENDKPPAHWTPDDQYADRQPQTPEEWDWRADSHDNGPLSRSVKRLNYGADRADPHAPDQMATVLRIDLMRVTAQLTWLEAKTRMQADKIAALTPSPLPATQEDAERGRVEGVRTGILWQLGVCADNYERDGKDVEARITRWHMGWIEHATFGAISTPQRQEYDGEAVREAVIEECARIADNWNPDRWDRVTETSIAEAIRALPPHQGAGEP